MSLIHKTVNESFLLDLAPSSLAKLIARDRAMSTLNALANHLINENKGDMQGLYSGLSSKFICKMLALFPKKVH
jgi:hypothetical protein